jgi:hypothetical protein
LESYISDFLCFGLNADTVVSDPVIKLHQTNSGQGEQMVYQTMARQSDPNSFNKMSGQSDPKSYNKVSGQSEHMMHRTMSGQSEHMIHRTACFCHSWKTINNFIQIISIFLDHFDRKRQIWPHGCPRILGNCVFKSVWSWIFHHTKEHLLVKNRSVKSRDYWRSDGPGTQRFELIDYYDELQGKFVKKMAPHPFYRSSSGSNMLPKSVDNQ